MRSQKEADYSGEVRYARDDRAGTSALGRIYMGLFLAILGPIALVLAGVMDFAPTKYFQWGVNAVGPVGCIMGVYNVVRLTMLKRLTAVAVVVLLATIGAAALTWWMTRSYANPAPL